MRRALLLIVILALIIGGGALLFRVLFPADVGPHHAAIDASLVDPPLHDPEDGGGGSGEDGGATPTRAVVVDVRGTTQRQLENGRWVDLAPGESLSLDDTVRTLSGGGMQLRLGNAVQVRLTSRTEVTIRELSERASRVRIREGRVVAEVDPAGKTVLRVEAKGSDAVAEAQGGRFSVISDGRGHVAVATTVGTIKLTAGGESVEVGAGQTSLVVGEAAPSAPTDIPKSLFLKVAGPEKEIQREPETVVEGKTQPGSLVRVGARIAQVAADGSFRIKVPLREGENRLEVKVTDVAGREKSQQLAPITVDTKEPEIQNTEVHWGEDE